MSFTNPGFTDEQWEGYNDIVSKMFINNKRWVVVLGEPQSGKTGVILACCHGFESNPICSPHIGGSLVTTGMNYKDWCTQTNGDIADLQKKGIQLPSHLYLCKNSHIGKGSWYNQYQAIIQSGKSAVIYLDESHFATKQAAQGKKKTRPNQFFEKLGIDFHGDYEDVVRILEQKKIYLVTISATPYGELARLYNNSFDKSAVVRLRTSSTYYSIRDAWQDGLIHQSTPIVDDKQQLSVEFQQEIERIKSNPSMHRTYVIIRDDDCVVGGKVKSSVETAIADECHRQGLSSAFKTLSSSKSSDYKSAYDVQGGSIFAIQPDCLTFVFVNDMLRVSVRVDTRFIVSFWDQASSYTKDETQVQSFAGRRCGYNKSHHDIKIYTNMKSIENYLGVLKDSGNIIRISSNQVRGQKTKVWTGSPVTVIDLTPAQSQLVVSMCIPRTQMKQKMHSQGGQAALCAQIPVLGYYINNLENSDVGFLHEESKYENSVPYVEKVQEAFTKGKTLRLAVGADKYCRVLLNPTNQRVYCWNAGQQQSIDKCISSSIFAEDCILEINEETGEVKEILDGKKFFLSWQKGSIDDMLNSPNKFNYIGCKAESVAHIRKPRGEQQVGDTYTKKCGTITKMHNNISPGDHIIIGEGQIGKDRVYALTRVVRLIEDEQHAESKGKELWPSSDCVATHECEPILIISNGLNVTELAAKRSLGQNRWGQYISPSISLMKAEVFEGIKNKMEAVSALALV